MRVKFWPLARRRSLRKGCSRGNTCLCFQGQVIDIALLTFHSFASERRNRWAGHQRVSHQLCKTHLYDIWHHDRNRDLGDEDDKELDIEKMRQ
jgi:hypothetical protein